MVNVYWSTLNQNLRLKCVIIFGIVISSGTVVAFVLTRYFKNMAENDTFTAMHGLWVQKG